jgi:hypothetical protein
MSTVDAKSMLVFNSARMAKDAHASLRLPAELKLEIEKISETEARPVSSVLELLVRRGLAQYRDDGILRPTPPPKRRGKKSGLDPASEQFANDLVEKLFERLRREKP